MSGTVGDQMESNGPGYAAREILVRGARAVARGDGLAATLQVILGSIAKQLDVESAVVVVVVDEPDRLRIVASTGLGEAAVAGLAEALHNPGHPIARTVREPVPTFDVQPTVPGGPALRSHLPLTVSRDGSEVVLGVLALAHHGSLGADARLLIEAAADLAAVAVELDRGP